VFLSAHVDVELVATGVNAPQGEGVTKPGREGLDSFAKEAGGAGRSTWNVYGDVWPKARDVPGRHATGGRISDQRETMKATAGPRIPA
jgi:hypothetical protein